MKKTYTICLIILFFATGNTINAQEESNVKKGGIYILNITLSENLIEEYNAANYEIHLNRGYSLSTILPDSLLTAIRDFSEEICQKKLKADVKCIYKVSKKGDIVTTVGYGHIEGMPTNSFNGALSSANLDYYIRVDVTIHTGGESIFFGKGMWSKIKPGVNAEVKIFDAEKNEVFENKVSIKDFSSIRSNENTPRSVTKTYSETFGPVDIFLVYKSTMNRLFMND